MTFLVTLSEKSLAERFSSLQNRYGGMREYILSDDGRSACDAVKKSHAVAKASIKKLVPKSDLENSLAFSAVINGITVKAPLSSMQKLRSINGVSSVSVLYDDMFFMDNDDLLHKSCLEVLFKLQIQEDADVIMGGRERFSTEDSNNRFLIKFNMNINANKNYSGNVNILSYGDYEDDIIWNLKENE